MVMLVLLRCVVVILSCVLIFHLLDYLSQLVGYFSWIEVSLSSVVTSCLNGIGRNRDGILLLKLVIREFRMTSENLGCLSTLMYHVVDYVRI